MATRCTAPVLSSCAFVCAASSGSAATAGTYSRPGRLDRTSATLSNEGNFMRLCVWRFGAIAAAPRASTAHPMAFMEYPSFRSLLTS